MILSYSLLFFPNFELVISCFEHFDLNLYIEITISNTKTLFMKYFTINLFIHFFFNASKISR